MDTKEEFDDEQMFKKIEQHNRNVNVIVSLTVVATMLIGVMVMRIFLMEANAQEVKSKFEMKFEEDVMRFKQEIADAGETARHRNPQNVRDSVNYESSSHHTKNEFQQFYSNNSEYKKEYKKTEYSSNQSKTEAKTDFKQDRYAGLQVDINTADTAELRKLPGIGEKRAMNIVKYRTSLGGFYSVEQLAEVYSMDAALVERLKQYIICDSNSVAKIDINNTIPHKLWHPYLKGELLKTIKQRIKSGKRYRSFDEIKAEVGYDENLNGRAEKYLEFR